MANGLGFCGGLAGLAWTCAVRRRLRGVAVAVTVARRFVAVVAIQSRIDRAIDGSQPVHVLWTHPAHDLGVDALNLARHRADLARPDGTVVYVDHGGDLRAGAGQEDL